MREAHGSAFGIGSEPAKFLQTPKKRHSQVAAEVMTPLRPIEAGATHIFML
jgi:hypothetical protein